MAETIGEKLRLAREARNITFNQASEATRIRPYYLQALEKDDYTSVPSAAQARGFLRIYATYLGLDVEELLSATHFVQPGPTAAPTVAPIPGISAAAAQSTGPGQGDVKTNPGFLTSLLGRFTHRPAAQPSVTTVTPDRPASQPEAGLEPKPQVNKTSVPESEPSLPVTVKIEPASVSKVEPRAELPASETLQAAPDKAPDKKTVTPKSTKSRTAPKEKAATTSSKGKKTVVKLKKSPDDTIPVEPLNEKKKITE